MSTEPGSPEDKLYCSTDDVANFFDKFSGPNGSTTFSGGFDTDTNPTESEVEMLIEEQTEWIEEYTGHAWREKRVNNEQMDLSRAYYFNAGTPFQLMHRDVRDLDAAQGDKLEVFAGSIESGSGDGYEEWVSSSTYTEGRNEGDYWLNNEEGKVYIYKAGYFFDRYKYIRVTYRYGKKKVPAAIRNACAKLVAADLLKTQQFRVTNPGSEEAPDPMKVAESYEEQVKNRLDNYKEVKSLGINM